MKRMTIFAAASAALLVGCSGGKTDADGDGEISAKEVATKAEAEGIKPQPGLYKATITMTGIDVPGMPAEMKGHGAGATTTSEDCLTAEDVDKGFEELVKKGQNGECAYESFNLNGGKLDAVMVCKTPEGDARMAMPVHVMRSFRVNHPGGKLFTTWIGGPKGRAIVAAQRGYRPPA
jgi:hypothetical protein